jgi:hypothetical protein
MHPSRHIFGEESSRRWVGPKNRWFFWALLLVSVLAVAASQWSTVELLWRLL